MFWKIDLCFGKLICDLPFWATVAFNPGHYSLSLTAVLLRKVPNLVPRAHDPAGLWQGLRALAGPNFLSMRRVFVSSSQPIGFARFDFKIRDATAVRRSRKYIFKEVTYCACSRRRSDCIASRRERGFGNFDVLYKTWVYSFQCFNEMMIYSSKHEKLAI